MSPSPPSDALRSYLADPGLRRALASMVQTRVPARDAEDVVQSVLCAALAAEAVPADASHLPRWIARIARHKVADVHRRTHREPGPVEEREIEVPAPAFELREIAERIAYEAARDADATRTLAWIEREHEGETWADIAKAERLPGAVVRKRISRFRRALRMRWLGAIALLLAAGVSAVEARRAPEAIVAEDSGSAALAALAANGDWRVERIVLDADASTEVRALAEIETARVRIHVDGALVQLASPLRSAAYHLTRVERAGARETLFLRDDAGRDHRVVVTRGDAVEVRIDEGPWRGTLVLRRE